MGKWRCKGQGREQEQERGQEQGQEQGQVRAVRGPHTVRPGPTAPGTIVPSISEARAERGTFKPGACSPGLTLDGFRFAQTLHTTNSIWTAHRFSTRAITATVVTSIGPHPRFLTIVEVAVKKRFSLVIMLLALALAAGCSGRQDGIDALEDAYEDGFLNDSSGTDLAGTDGIIGRDTIGTDLAGTDLAGTDLAGTDLSGTDVEGFDIMGTDLTGMDLAGIDINGLDIDFPDTDDPDVDQPDVDQPDDTIQGDEGGDTYVPPTECDNPVIPEPSSGSCSVTAGSNYLLLRGDVFGPDNILRNAMVLIDPTGFIACADCDCSGTTGYDGATVIACPEALITPGLINGHDHVTYDGNSPKAHTVKYDHRHEWRTGDVAGKPKISVPQTTGAEEWSELRHVVGGATAMFGSGHGTGLLRNLDQELIDIPESYEAKYDTFPLDDNTGVMLTSGCGYPGITQWSSVSGFKAYVPHISEGINAAANNEFQCLSSTDGGGQDLVRENSGIIHGIGLTAADIAQMAVDGTGLIWSVRTNIDLYGNTASITLYDKLGVDIGLGPDWTASGSMNMLREMNCVDYLNRNHFNNYFSDRRIVELATAGNARVFNIDDKIGLLKPGLVADIAIFSTATNPDERALIDGNPGDVLLTMRSGIPLYGETNLVDALLPGDAGCEALSVCGVAKKVCAKRETGVALATMQTQASGWYDLFFCGVPASEPSCEPSRPGEYDGVTATDDDGDGVADVDDNCPLIFNPARPMDNDVQPDADADGEGDVCDTCPFDPDTTECTGFDPDDVDGDGYPNDLDNCPRDFNDPQTDFDEDEKGDACDECPEDYNPGTDACPATIYDVKNGVVAVGNRVALSDVIVTAVAKTGTTLTGFFVQVDPSADYYAGTDNSAVYVYAKGFTPIPTVGSVVSFTGTVTLYWGQLEMTGITGFTASGTALLPDPELVLPTEVMTGGSRAASLEGALVEVQDVTVTNTAPTVGGGDSAPINEFVVDNGVRVNDFMYLVTPFPVVNDQFESIVGVLRLANDNFKIEPRDAMDVIAITPELALKMLSTDESWFEWELAGAPAVPTVHVVMNRSLLAGEAAEVTFTTDAGGLVSADPVVITEGSNAAEVLFTGLSVESAVTPVDLCAHYGDTSVCNVLTLVPATYNPVIMDIAPQTPISLAAGTTKTIEVFFDVPVFAADTEVTILLEDDTKISAPTMAPVTPGSVSVSFDVTGLATGSSMVYLGFGTSGAEFLVEVTDVPLVPNVLIAEVFYNPGGTDSGYEWVKLYNAGAAAQDLTGWSLANGGTSWAIGKWDLSGSLPAGGCIVIGGPLASAENGNPTYDLVLDFTPDIQNSGTASEAADGVGLFDIPAASVTASSIPVDAVIYGGINSNSLIGPDGGVAAVDVANAPSGDSIARTGESTWVIRADPTPMTCPAW